MVRNNGNWQFYIIEHSWQGKPYVCSIENESYFKASQDCWQKTGIYGTFNKDYAIECYNKVKDTDINRKFRLSLITINQKTEVIEQ